MTVDKLSEDILNRASQHKLRIEPTTISDGTHSIKCCSTTHYGRKRIREGVQVSAILTQTEAEKDWVVGAVCCDRCSIINLYERENNNSSNIAVVSGTLNTDTFSVDDCDSDIELYLSDIDVWDLQVPEPSI